MQLLYGSIAVIGLMRGYGAHSRTEAQRGILALSASQIQVRLLMLPRQNVVRKS